jgi:hypothetical protein
VNKQPDLMAQISEWNDYIDWLRTQPLPSEKPKPPLEQAADQLKAAEKKIAELKSKVSRHGRGGSSGSSFYYSDGGMF